MWYQIGQGSPPRQEGKHRIKNHEEGNWKYLALFFPKHGMDIAISLKDSGVNEAVTHGLDEPHSAWNEAFCHHSAKSLQQEEVSSESSMLKL